MAEDLLDGRAGVRAPERERDATIRRLQAACVAGQLTLGEFGRRVETAFSACTSEDLEGLIGDLPAPPPPPSQAAGLAAGPGRGRGTRLSLSILGSHHRSGHWTLPARLVHLSVLGGAEWDLSGAVMAQPVTTITVVSLLGSTDVRIPDHIDAEVGGLALLGGHHVDLGETSPPANAPLIRLRHLSLLGSVRVLRGEPAEVEAPPPAPLSAARGRRDLRRAERWRRREERRRRRHDG